MGQRAMASNSLCHRYLGDWLLVKETRARQFCWIYEPNNHTAELEIGQLGCACLTGRVGLRSQRSRSKLKFVPTIRQSIVTIRIQKPWIQAVNSRLNFV